MRSLRKRQVIGSYTSGERKGTYWAFGATSRITLAVENGDRERRALKQTSTRHGADSSGLADSRYLSDSVWTGHARIRAGLARKRSST